MKENIIKGALAVLLTGAAAYFRQLLAPVIVLLIVMIIDYVTGMVQAWASSTLSSRVGIMGIIKKIGYLLAIAVAVVVDYLIASTAARAGANLTDWYAFGLLVTIWLILNECISILENLSEIGVPLPGFLIAIVKKLKKTTEKVGDAQAKPDPEDLPEDLSKITDADPYAAFGVSGELPEDAAPDPTHPPDEK